MGKTDRADGPLKLRFLLQVMGLAAMGGGCAAMASLPLASVLGSPNSQNLQMLQHTEVRIQQENFVTVHTNVVGKSKGFSLLGFITIVPAKVDKAMDRLYAHAQVQQGQPETVANMILEQNSSYYILFGIPRTTVRADIIRFTPPPPTVQEQRLPQAAPP